MTAIKNSDNDKKKQLDDALALAKTGNFKGTKTILDAIADENQEIRIKAAGYWGQIGFKEGLEKLGNMALKDPVSDNRNQAIYALGSIGRPAVVPFLIDALNDEESARRVDAQTVLYRMFGREVLVNFEDDEEEKDGGDGDDKNSDTALQMKTWWKNKSKAFDKNLVYYMGEPASPGLFIQQLKVTTTPVPDAILTLLRNWTGMDNGQRPLSTVIAHWEKWWSTNKKKYEPGKKYFHGHLVP